MAELAFEKLYLDVLARFGAEAAFGTVPSASAAALTANPFGWHEPVRQLRPHARIVWMPGDPQGNAGELKPPRYPGRNPRPLATLWELFTVDVHGWDPNAPTSELAQYRATRLLYDTWFRAVYLAAYGTFDLKSTTWITTRNEGRFGATLRVVGLIQAMIPDRVESAAPVDTAAVIAATQVVTQTESFTVNAPLNTFDSSFSDTFD